MKFNEALNIAALRNGFPETAAVSIDSAISNVDQDDTRLRAFLMKYETLLARQTGSIIADHTAPIQSKNDLQRAFEVYDRTYLQALSLSYPGLSALCAEFIRLCHKFDLPVPGDWRELHDLNLDWEEETEALSLQQ